MSKSVGIVMRQGMMQTFNTVAPFLAAACRAHPLASLDKVFTALLSGMADLMLCLDDGEIVGAMVLEVQEYPDGQRVCNLWLLGMKPGTFRGFMELLDEALDTWSRENDCDTIAMLGRPGWQKRLPDHWHTQPMVQAWRSVRNGDGSERDEGHLLGDAVPEDGVRRHTH